VEKKRKVLKNVVNGLEGKKYFLVLAVDEIITSKMSHTRRKP
jgi:hypothetical protein